MSKQKMERARELIRDKKYGEARVVLATVDHPTATKWLARLDEIAPVKPGLTWSNYLLIGMVIAVTILAIVAVYLMYSDQQEMQRTTDLKFRAYRYCLDMTTSADCRGWADREAESRFRLKVIAECDRRAGSLNSEFADCMIRENILPPGIVRTR